MQRIFKYAVSVLFFLFLVIAAFTVETVAEEIGYVRYLKDVLSKGAVSLLDWQYSDWILFGSVFFAGATSALWVDGFLRKKTTVQIPKKTKITEFFDGDHFENQEIRLDGCSYKNCTFKKVKLTYNGGKCYFSNNKLDEFWVRTEVPEIIDFIKLNNALDQLGGPLYDHRGHLVEVGSTDAKKP